MVGDPVAVVDGQCVQDGLPAVGLAVEVLSVLAFGGGDKVEDFHGGLLVGEVPSVSYGSSEPGVEALDGVGGVDHPAQFGGELQERCELVPGLSPGPDHGRVGGFPVFGKGLEECLGGPCGGGCVDGPHGFGDRAPVLARSVTQAVAHHVHHAGLHRGVGPGGPDRLRQAPQTVTAHDQRVDEAVLFVSCSNSDGTSLNVDDTTTTEVPAVFACVSIAPMLAPILGACTKPRVNHTYAEEPVPPEASLNSLSVNSVSVNPDSGDPHPSQRGPSAR